MYYSYVVDALILGCKYIGENIMQVTKVFTLNKVVTKMNDLF